MVLYGLGLSLEKYDRLRNMLSFTTSSQAEKERETRQLERQALPPVARYNNDLKEKIITAVRQQGGGKNIGKSKGVTWGGLLKGIAPTLQSMSLKQWAQNPANGTFAKTIYLSQLALDEKILAEADYIVGGQDKIDWDKVGSKLIERKLISNVEDLPYLLEQSYVTHYGLDRRARRKRLRIVGEQLMPVLPSAADIEEDVVSPNVLRDTEQKPYLTDDEIFDKLKNENILYMGRDVSVPETANNGKSRVRTGNVSTIRIFDLRFQLIRRVKELLDQAILQPPNKEDVHTLCLGDWQDGCSALSWSTLCLQAGILCLPPLFSEKHFVQVTEMVPIAIGFCPEITDNVVRLREYIAPMIERLRAPFFYNGFKFQFCLKRVKADFPMLCKVFGYNSSGYSKCPFCNVSFRDKSKLFDFQHYHKCSLRSLLNNATLFADQPDQAQRRGLKEKNGLLSVSTSNKHGARQLGPLERLEAAGLKDYEPAIDALHVIKGAAAAFIDAEKIHRNSRKKSTWDSSEFARRLINEVGRDSLAKCKGIDYRLIFVKYKKVILPRITNSKEEKTYLNSVIFGLRFNI